MPSFPYEQRAQAVNKAQRANTEAASQRSQRDPVTIEAWKRTVAVFWSADASAFPQDFHASVEKLKARDPSGVERAIEFLDADPIFFQSGYWKSRLVRYLLQAPLTPQQKDRLKEIVLKIVQRRNTWEFQAFCRLAYLLRDGDISVRLRELSELPDPSTTQRAKWMLLSLENWRFVRLTDFAHRTDGGRKKLEKGLTLAQYLKKIGRWPPRSSP